MNYPKTPANGYSKTQILAIEIQISRPEFEQVLGWTPDFSKRSVQSCCPSKYLPIHNSQDASTPVEIYKTGSFGERHLWRDCVILDKELELNGFEAPVFLHTKTLTQQVTKLYPEKHRPACHNCKRPSNYRVRCCRLKKGKDSAETSKNSDGNNIKGLKTVVKQSSTITTTKTPVMSMLTILTTETTENHEISTHPVGLAAERSTTEKSFFGANAANRPPLQNRLPKRQNQVKQKIAQNYGDMIVQAAAQTLN